MPYIAILLSALAVLRARKEMERNRQMAIQGIILVGHFWKGSRLQRIIKYFDGRSFESSQWGLQVEYVCSTRFPILHDVPHALEIPNPLLEN